MPKISTACLTFEPDPQHPILGGGLGPSSYNIVGDLGGLTQFGAHVEVLHPGSRSSQKHWHETEDEMIYMILGEVVLIENDCETVLKPGDAACWPAGLDVAHCLENRTDHDASYLTIGTRNQRDIIHYSEHDLVTHKNGNERSYFHKDGTPYQGDEND